MYFYFLANNIAETDKLALFLSNISASWFGLLQNLAAPAKLSNAAMTFAKVTTMLDEHFADTESILSATYEFYSCHQQPNQSAADWIASLRAKAIHCGFTDSKLAKKPLDRALRDMLVIGTNDPRVREALLKATDPTFEEAEKIVKTAEQLRGNVSKFERSSSASVAKIQQPEGRKSPNQSNSRKRA